MRYIYGEERVVEFVSNIDAEKGVQSEKGRAALGYECIWVSWMVSSHPETLVKGKPGFEIVCMPVLDCMT